MARPRPPPSGRITLREARWLHNRGRVIAQHEARFKADGVVSQRERRQLRSEVAQLRDNLERMLRANRRRG